MRTKFRKVVAELAQDIQTGKLVPGDRLPTHRELAYRFGLSLGTATRVFAELEAMGLTVGEVGRGTFVRMQGEGRAVDFALADPDQSIVDFSLNRFILPEQEVIFSASVTRVLADKGFDSLDYRNSVGAEYDRCRIANWLNDDREGTPFDLAQLTICSGGQHALMLALMSACHAGQAVAVEDYTYPVVRLACEMLHLDVVTVESDEEGICPASLDALCEDEGVRMLFTMPNVQNPMSVTMSVKRRHAIAGVLKRRNILALEDDAYGFLLEQPPVSLCDLAPDHVFYSRTLSKSWAPGLRICYLVAPTAFSRQIDKAQRATVWMSTPLMVSVATDLVATGHYEAIVSLKRREIAKRQKIVRRVLGDLDLITDPRSMHVMLKLPSGIRTGEFLAALQERNVVASPLRQFVASRDCVKVPEGIRLCIGSPSNRKSLEEALVCVQKALESFNTTP